MRYIKYSVLLILITFGIALATSCTSPTGSNNRNETISDGEFFATVDNDYTFTGEASFDTLITNYQSIPDIYQDTIAALVLKAGEISVPNREPISTGIFMNALWDEENPEFDLESNPYFVNYYVPPKITSMSAMYTIKSGTVTVEAYSGNLLTGSFNLVAEDALDDSVTITGSFKALRVNE